MATRHWINRLSERTEALVARLKPPGRIFSMGRVQNHRNADAEFASFRKQHGLTEDDAVTAMCVVPWADRPADFDLWEKRPQPRLEYKGNVLLQIQLVKPQLRSADEGKRPDAEPSQQPQGQTRLAPASVPMRPARRRRRAWQHWLRSPSPG